MKKRTARKWIPAQWTFESRAVATRFDRHVREQLPWYDHLLHSIVHVGAHYIPRNDVVYDVGASTGNVLRALSPYLIDRQAEAIGIEPSREMSRQAIASGRCWTEWIERSALDVEFKPFDFAVLNLVLMFLPVGSRAGFVRKLVELLRPGGAIVVVDKILSPPGYLGQVMRRLAMKGKLEAGCSAEEILEKELSLGGVQRPISPHVVPVTAWRFFQFGEFVGWVYEKEETGLEPNHNFR